MAVVKVGDELVQDRRKNGARLKLSFNDWFKVSCFIVGIIITGIVGWVTLQLTVGRHDVAIADQEKEIKEVRENVEVQKVAWISLKGDVKATKEQGERIEQKVDKLIDRLIDNG